MNISQAGLDLIRKFEGCRLTAYDDSVAVHTIGYGHTFGVYKGDTCTQEQAEQWLKEDAHHAENCVNHSVSVDLTQNEYDALVSFVFNLGCGALSGSTLLRKLNAGDFDGASDQFKRWDHADGKVLAGLTVRREAEADLFRSA